MARTDFTHCVGNGAKACDTCKRRDPVPATNTDPWFVWPSAVGDRCMDAVPRDLLDVPTLANSQGDQLVA